MTDSEFREKVSDRMMAVYGITWADACGDDDILRDAHDDGTSPEEFVDWLVKNLG